MSLSFADLPFEDEHGGENFDRRWCKNWNDRTDETTFEYLKGRPLAPQPDSLEWKGLSCTVRRGHRPHRPITGVIPGPDDFSDPPRKTCQRAMIVPGSGLVKKLKTRMLVSNGEMLNVH